MGVRSQEPPLLDGNGTITALELETLARGVLGPTALSKDQIEDIIRHVDIDGSGTIDFDEFLNLMSDPKFNLAKDEHRQVFEMFDKDNSGHISIAELKAAFRNLGGFLPNLPPTSKSHRVIHDLF